MDRLRARLAYARSALAAANAGPGATLTSINSPHKLPECRPYTAEDIQRYSEALSAELLNCQEYTVNGIKLLMTEEEHERMTAK